MNERVSNRHEGDLGGKLLPFGNTTEVGVTVAVAPATAHLASVQHTAWMLLNPLARMEHVVQRVTLVCPEKVPVAGRVVPLAPTATDLRTALVTGVDAIGVVPLAAQTADDRLLVIGGGGIAGREADLYVRGNAWTGGYSRAPLEPAALGAESDLPFGPYLAASLAASEVFKAARMRPEQCNSPSSAFYNCWRHHVGQAPLVAGPSTVGLELDATLAGVGAVGSATLHAMWACPDVRGRMTIADNDAKGVDATNLNRYPLFGRDALGKPKASTAKVVLTASPLDVDAFDGPFEDLRFIRPRVLSAVDRNHAREAIQNRYPARILSASTRDLRAEVLRCGPPGVGACLRCYNPPERIIPDADLRAQLARATEDELASIADKAGVSVDDARRWVTLGQCGTVGSRLIGVLRIDVDGPQAFAVSFVSMWAGTVLAAELLKDQLGTQEPLNQESHRAVFQFFSPLARINRASPLPRDPSCPMCVPESPAATVWQRRFDGLTPSRIGEGEK